MRDSINQKEEKRVKLEENRVEVFKLKHSIYCRDNETGRILAEVTFPETSQGVYNIDHTFVSETMRGSGLAGKLVSAAVDSIHEQGGIVTATCPYARQWMEKNKIYR